MNAKRVTSEDVARRAGVSRTTVSLVLNDVQSVQISEETRQRVIETARELDYVPDAAAQALASRRVKIIGLIMTRDRHNIVADIFLTQILDGLIEAVTQHDFRLLIDIVDPEDRKESYLKLVRSKRIDGVVISGPRFNDEAYQALKEYGFPVIVMGQIPGQTCCFVDVDNFQAAKNAVSYLIELGHKKIVCITNAPLSFTAAAARLQGYRAALEEADLPFDPSLVAYGNFDADSGYHQMSKLLDHPPKGEAFTAVFAASDVVAFGAKAALRERDFKIPEDIAMVGFDDVPLARYIDPPLTTVRLPAYEIGWTAGNQLVRMISGEGPEHEQIILDTQLIVRQSCGSGLT